MPQVTRRDRRKPTSNTGEREREWLQSSPSTRRNRMVLRTPPTFDVSRLFLSGANRRCTSIAKPGSLVPPRSPTTANSV